MKTDSNASVQETSPNPIALGIAVAAGIVATILRIVPHPPNFSGVGALGLFGGARLRAWQAFLFPLGIMVVSDLALWVLTGFDEKYSLAHLSRAYVYASFMIYVALGRWLCKRDSIGSVVLAGTLGGLQFFLLTNFCEWLFQPFQPGYDAMPEVFRYSRDWAGLVSCFAYALPFYGGDAPGVDHPFMLFTDFRLSLLWTCLGDVVFTITYILVYRQFAQRAAVAPTPPVLSEAHS